MIAIIDYGMGNLGSIQNMLKRIGTAGVITSDAQLIMEAEKLILPGVGAFDTAMKRLGSLGFISLLNTLVLEKKRLILGICLGMQLMTKRSEEGVVPGLGWFDADTVKFVFSGQKSLKIPHMGWNRIDLSQDCYLFNNTNEEQRFYFVHSYHVCCRNHSDIIATSDHGGPFCAAVCKDNIYGVQFHPEKSHKFGMQLLKKFAELC